MKFELTEESIDALADQLFEKLVDRVAEKLAEEAPERVRPYSVAEAAEEIGVSGRTVQRMVADGQLDRLSGTGRVLITVESMKAFLAGGDR